MRPTTVNSALDPLIATARSVEADVKTLASNLSRPPLPLSSGVQREFIESNLAQCDKMKAEMDAIEASMSSATVGDAIDEVRRFSKLLRDKAAAVQVHFAKYGFVPDPNYDLTLEWTPDLKDTTSLMSPSVVRSSAAGGLVAAAATTDDEDEPEAEYDPPSPTLESFGISSMALGILNSEHEDGPPSPVSRFSNFSAANRSLIASSDGYSSPSVPQIATSSLSVRSRQSDPNSIFGQLIRAVNADEFAVLPEFVTAQLSVKSLNDAISEINEYVTDKRFSSMDSDEDAESVTLDELMHVEGLDKNKIKAVLVALLQLGRVGSADDGRGGKRYLL